MIYLSQFEFVSENTEYKFFEDIKRTCYTTFYPFQVLSAIDFRQMNFEPITILYGGNGSGKTTALNIIAQTLGLQREAPFNQSDFFQAYTDLCSYEANESIPPGSRIITSDDVFDYMLDMRALNEGIDGKRQAIFEDFIETKHSTFQMNSLSDYEQLKKTNLCRRTTQSKFVKARLTDNVRERSNGENAFRYFVEKIQNDALYLLDEPENSLSVKKQLELVEFLEQSSRYFGCQLVISTHSPFILSMKGARIYDLDEERVDIKSWTELENVRSYYDFFISHRKEFEK